MDPVVHAQVYYSKFSIPWPGMRGLVSPDLEVDIGEWALA